MADKTIEDGRILVLAYSFHLGWHVKNIPRKSARERRKCSHYWRCIAIRGQWRHGCDKCGALSR